MPSYVRRTQTTETSPDGFPVREELATVAYASNLLKSRPHEISMTVRDTAALEGDAPNGSAVSGTDGAGTDGAGGDQRRMSDRISATHSAYSIIALRRCTAEGHRDASRPNAVSRRHDQ
jgi:hypothetical protein